MSWSTVFLVFLLVATTYCGATEDNSLDDDDTVNIDRTTLSTVKLPNPGRAALQALWRGFSAARKVGVERIWHETVGALGDISLPANMLHLLSSAGALVLGVIGVAVVLSLVLPLFGVKVCHLLGTCDHYGSPFLASQPIGAVGQAYDAYTTAAGTYNNPGVGYSSPNYQKRSLEYVGPILKALSTAYDKYATPQVTPVTATSAKTR